MLFVLIAVTIIYLRSFVWALINTPFVHYFSRTMLMSSHDIFKVFNVIKDKAVTRCNRCGHSIKGWCCVLLCISLTWSPALDKVIIFVWQSWIIKLKHVRSTFIISMWNLFTFRQLQQTKEDNTAAAAREQQGLQSERNP